MPYDLWDDAGGTKVKATKPQPVTLDGGKWFIDAEKVAQPEDGPRKRPYQKLQRPSNRSAVHVPLEGQSYNPLDDEHQKALLLSTKQLQKKREKHDAFVRQMKERGQVYGYKGNLSADHTWDEEVVETKPKAVSSGPESSAKDKKNEKKKKKKNKLIAKKEAFHSMKHKLHPDRRAVLTQLSEVESIKQEVQAKLEKSAKRKLARKQTRLQNTAVKKFGRNVHQPLPIDVAATDELVGSLRTIRGGHHHPALERMKSLEERNLVPARMRHQYNKAKILKPKGELTVKKEPVGLMLDTSKRQ